MGLDYMADFQPVDCPLLSPRGHRSFSWSSFPGDTRQPFPSEQGTGPSYSAGPPTGPGLRAGNQPGPAQPTSGAPISPRPSQVKVRVSEPGLRQCFSD